MRLGVIVAIAGALLLGGAPVGAQYAVASEMTEALDLRLGETLLEVDAQGVSRDVPDVLSLEVGVVTTGTTAQAALDADSTTVNAVLEAIDLAGIALRPTCRPPSFVSSLRSKGMRTEDTEKGRRRAFWDKSRETLLS